MSTYFKKIVMTDRQREIIIGTLLGDGHLETLTNGKTYRLRIMHSEAQKEYMDWLYNELKSIASQKPQAKIYHVNGKSYIAYWFDTVSSTSFRFYAQQFYKDGIKKVPNIVHRLLTPLSMAVWYMDDGSIKSHETKGRIMNTQGFSKSDVEKLILCLQKQFDISTHLRKQSEGWQIFIPAEMHERFVNLIDQYVIPSMKYKLLFPSARLTTKLKM